MFLFIADIQNGEAILSGEESDHCTKVLRKKAGDTILVTDGKGKMGEAVLTSVSRKECRAMLTDLTEHKARNRYLHLAIAPTKQIDRIEWMLEKCVEIGIEEVSFLQCKNSERTRVNTERMRKIAESAAKQSMQAFIPRINDLISFKDILSSEKYDHLLIAHCAERKKVSLKEIAFEGKRTLALIGPEGDFAPEEIVLAHEKGFQGLHLTENRLRTETAGLYLCQALSILA